MIDEYADYMNPDVQKYLGDFIMTKVKALSDTERYIAHLQLRNKQLEDAIVAHIDSEIKKYKNRIKYINEPKEPMTTEDKISYYNRTIERLELNKKSILNF